MRKIAFFDFDGTITTKDSLLEVIKYQKGTAAFYKGFLINSPYLLALKLKLLGNQAVKEKILKYFFGGMSLASFQFTCDLFIADKLNDMIRPAALAELEDLKSRGFEIVVVTASPENWVKKWCVELGIRVISTRLEVENQTITGRILGMNCHGEEKAIRIKAAYDLSTYNEVYCYGDSGGDKQMLAMATKAFYKPFRE